MIYSSKIEYKQYVCSKSSNIGIRPGFFLPPGIGRVGVTKDGGKKGWREREWSENGF